MLHAEAVAEIDPEPFYIYNMPGSMEVAAAFRPHVEIEKGLVKLEQAYDNELLSVDLDHE